MTTEKKTKLIFNKNFFLKTQPEKVVFTQESFFPERFLDLLKKTLGSPSDFLKSTAAERMSLVEKIQGLLFTESVCKSLVSKSKYQEEHIRNLFPNELEIFKEKFKTLFFPHGKKLTHKQVLGKFASFKCITFYSNMLTYLKKNNIIFFNDLELPDDSQIEKMLVNKIQPDLFFCEIVKICMKKTYDQNFNYEILKHRKLQNKELGSLYTYIRKDYLLYQVQKIIVIYLINQLIDYTISTNNNNTQEPADILRHITHFISDFKHDLDRSENKWYRDTYDIANVLINIFCISGVVIGQETIYIETTSYNKPKTITILYLNHLVSNTIPFSQHLPQIVPPNDLNAKEDFVKSITRGKSVASISTEAINSLNIAQKKKFKVNEIYLNLLEKFHKEYEYSLLLDETPYPTVSQWRELKDLKQSWDKSLTNCLQIYINSRANNYLSTIKKDTLEQNKFNTKNLYKDALKISDISKVEYDINGEKYKLKINSGIVNSKQQLLYSSISIAKIFMSFPIYYGTKLDYRTRMYPLEYLLSRTTGELKHLVCDFDSINLTLKGLKNLMLASFRYSFKITLMIQNCLSTDTLNEKQMNANLKKLFEKFNLVSDYKSIKIINNDYKFKKKAIYFLTLQTVLQNYFDKSSKNYKKVNINLEIDQTASGMVLLSLLLGIKPMAQQCNLLSKEPTDIYLFIMKQIPYYFKNNKYKKTYYDENNKKKILEHPYDTGDVMTFLSTNRATQKGALMRWCYSEKALSRKDSWLSEFKEIYKRNCTTDEYNTFSAFSKNYDSFLEQIFPKVQEQKTLCLKVLNIRANALRGNSVNIKTLNGCHLSWDFSPMEPSNKSYHNPVTGKTVTYKIYTEKNSSDKALKKRIKDLERSLFPNLIHSIDAAIMRIIISKIHKLTNYRINHLHDCVLIHPNFVDTFYDVITEIYTGGYLNDLARRLYFEPMAEGVSEDVREEIKKIQNKFENNMEKIVITKENFESRNMYVLDGNVNNIDLFKKQDP
jgi:DNA-dependent RNA polymerase